jgi:hypothetical protein
MASIAGNWQSLPLQAMFEEKSHEKLCPQLREITKERQISERGVHPVFNLESPTAASSRQLRGNTRDSIQSGRGNTSGHHV